MSTEQAPMGGAALALPALPRALGRYELLHELAAGGMATVFLARVRGAAVSTGFVAVKVCHPHLRGDEDFVAMFRDEAQLAARIRHPNVVPTLDVGEDGSGAPFIVMEFVDGYTLHQLVRAAARGEQKVPPAVVLRIAVDALAGLHAAHELCDEHGAPLHIVHRDVSPQNVLVGLDGAVRILDFGVARAERRITVTREGVVKGKLAYMAPEQHGFGQAGVLKPVDRRADVFAAAVVLWEALTGERLLQAETDAETLDRLTRGYAPPPSRVAPGLSPAVDAVVLRALSREPAARPASARAFAEEIEACGVPLASPAEVGAYARSTLAAAIERRQTVLRNLSSPAPDRSQMVPRARVHTPDEGPELSLELCPTGTFSGPTEALRVRRLPQRSTAPATRRARLALAGILAVLALGAAGASAWLARAHVRQAITSHTGDSLARSSGTRDEAPPAVLSPDAATAQLAPEDADSAVLPVQDPSAATGVLAPPAGSRGRAHTHGAGGAAGIRAPGAPHRTPSTRPRRRAPYRPRFL